MFLYFIIRFNHPPGPVGDSIQAIVLGRDTTRYGGPGASATVHRNARREEEYL